MTMQNVIAAMVTRAEEEGGGENENGGAKCEGGWVG
jgi:hypothetical protein